MWPTHTAAQADPTTRLFAEKARIARPGRVRQLVFGSLDGLLVPLGVISGVAGGTGSSHAVLVAGLAEAFAGALSMGAGEFIAARSEAQVQQTEVAKELEEIRRQPAAERRELATLLAHEGLDAGDAARIVAVLVRYHEAYHKTMVEKELGLQLEPGTVKGPEALTMGGAYIVGSIFPLAPYFFLSVRAALPLSIALTLVALVVVGLIKGRLGRGRVSPGDAHPAVAGLLATAASRPPRRCGTGSGGCRRRIPARCPGIPHRLALRTDRLASMVSGPDRAGGARVWHPGRPQPLPYAR